jgi:putative DNA primase/helicase
VKVVELPGLLAGQDIVEFIELRDSMEAESIAAGIVALTDAAPVAVSSTGGPVPDDDAPAASGVVTAEVLKNAALLSDIGNSARFVVQHGPDLRYCHPWGKWLVWSGARWAIDDRGNVTKRAKRTALSIFDEAGREQNGEQQKKLAEHAVRGQKRERLAAMIDLARPDLSITPDEIDADPWLLNVLNGTVDLRTGQLRPHRQEDYITKIARANFTPGGNDAPTFQRFLDRIFRTHPALVAWMQKAFGYSATGLTSEQVLFFLHGHGANGKTTLLDAVGHALGDYGGKADRDLLTLTDGNAHPTNIADLMGRRLVVVAETNDGRRFDEGRLKDLVGETRLKARFMRGDFFEFTASHKVFLYSNHRPVVRGQDLGFWRRMRLVPFNETIDEAEKDTDLSEKLEAEADGILAWIVAGAVRWHAEGLGCPDEVTSATADYRSEMDGVGAFLQECCEIAPSRTSTARDLYAAYTRWAEEAGEKPQSQKRLGNELRNRGLEQGRDSYSGRTTWPGIGLKPTGSGPE